MIHKTRSIINENDKFTLSGKKIIITCKPIKTIYSSYSLGIKKVKASESDILFIVAFPPYITYTPGHGSYFIYAVDKYNNEYHIAFKDTNLSQAKAKKLFKEYFC